MSSIAWANFIGVGADAHAVLAPEPLLVFELAIEGRFDAFGVDRRSPRL